MRRLIKTLLLGTALAALAFTALSALGTTPAVACGDHDQTAQIATVEVPVDGMTCDGCAQRVAAEIQKLDGVQTATVSFDKKLATISYMPAKISVDTIIATIKKAGYTTGPQRKA